MNKVTKESLIEKYAEIRPLDENVILVWVDEFQKEHTRESGIVIARTVTRTSARWGLAVAVGPNSQVKVGEYVLPKLGPDLLSCKYGDRYVWKTTDDDITCVTDDIADTQFYNDGPNYEPITIK